MWCLNHVVTRNETTGMAEVPSDSVSVQLSLWPGGAALNAIGTIEWAGGTVDWNAEDIKGMVIFTLSVVRVDCALRHP